IVGSAENIDTGARGAVNSQPCNLHVVCIHIKDVEGARDYAGAIDVDADRARSDRSCGSTGLRITVSKNGIRQGGQGRSQVDRHRLTFRNGKYNRVKTGPQVATVNGSAERT